MTLERENKEGIQISRISEHAIQNVMTRWSLGIVEATQFIQERVGSPDSVERDKSGKKKRRNKYVIRSGDATFIGELNREGYEIITVMRKDSILKKMRKGKILRRKVRKIR